MVSAEGTESEEYGRSVQPRREVGCEELVTPTTVLAGLRGQMVGVQTAAEGARGQKAAATWYVRSGSSSSWKGGWEAREDHG